MNDDPVDVALHALSHPGRRTMLRLALDAERTSGELAVAAGLSRSAASQHLKVLRDAGLVRVRADATRRLYQVEPERLAALREALDALWSDRLDALQREAERMHGSRSTRGAASA